MCYTSRAICAECLALIVLERILFDDVINNCTLNSRNIRGTSLILIKLTTLYNKINTLNWPIV